MVRRVVIVLASLGLLVSCPESCPSDTGTEIASLEVEPTRVTRGGTVTVSWRVVRPGTDPSSTLPSCSLLRWFDGQPIGAVEPVEVPCTGSRQDQVPADVPLTATYVRYRLNALRHPFDATNPFLTRDVTVTLEGVVPVGQ